MNTQNNMPVWMRAFYGWADQMMSKWVSQAQCDPDEIGMSHCEEETNEFAASIDWDVCKCCLGPCGDCKEKHREQPCCDPCPQDVHGTTECTYCPIVMLKKLHGMRYEEINHKTAIV